jgi:hypothetical protein
MQKEYLKLIKNALAKGYVISVFDGEVWEVKKSSKYTEIKECIESVEVAQIRIRTGDDSALIGWAQIIPDLDPEETVADFTDNEPMHDLLEWKWAD